MPRAAEGRRRAWARAFFLSLLLAFAASPAEVAAQTTTPASFSDGYPTAARPSSGANALVFTAALDRAGSAYYVVVRQPNGLDGGAVTAPTPAEIFAGRSHGGSDADVFGRGSLAFVTPGVSREAIAEKLPDVARYNVYAATYAGGDDPLDPNDPGVASYAAVSLLDAAIVPDVTPPSFVLGAPRVRFVGPAIISLDVAVDEPAHAFALVLAADAAPPSDAHAVVAGTPPGGLAAVVSFSGAVNASVNALASLNVSGSISPGNRYAVYVAVRDFASPTPNLSPVVRALRADTPSCPECALGSQLAAGSCDCVVASTFTLNLDTTVEAFAAGRDAFRAKIAEQLGVDVAQVTVSDFGPSDAVPGWVFVDVVVVPLSSSDQSTASAVDSALAAGGISAGEDLGGEADVGGVVLSGEPDTRILATPRPRGRTAPITDDGRLPGHLLEPPETSNLARFRWKVWFGDTECTGCRSECALDAGEFVSCASPKFYQNLGEGEHNFRVRGLGGDGVPDASPARYTWTIRYKVEVLFAEMPATAVKEPTLSFQLGSNKAEAVFEYSLNGGDYPTYAELPAGERVVNVTSRIGANVFLARAKAEGETSDSVARAMWIYDVHPPTTNVTSESVRNGSSVNKFTDVRFTLRGNDTDPNFRPSSDVARIDVRFALASNGSVEHGFDFEPVANLQGRTHVFSLSDRVNLSAVPNAMYVLTARAADGAGNSRDGAGQDGYDRYFFYLTDEVPSAATITPGHGREDELTPVWDDPELCPEENRTVCVRQLKITPEIVGEGEPEAYKIVDVSNGQVFYPDGATEIRDGDFVDKVNATFGLRFLPAKDAHSDLLDQDGARVQFGFTVLPSATFDDQGVVDIPVRASVTVAPVNDPPTLDVSADFVMNGVSILESPINNFGDAVAKIVAPGFADVDGPWGESLDNMGLAVVGADATRGTWEWTSDYGANWTSFPSDLAPTRPLLLRATALDRVRYRPDYPGVGLPLDDVAWSASFAFRAWDGQTEGEWQTGERGRWVETTLEAVNVTLDANATSSASNATNATLNDTATVYSTVYVNSTRSVSAFDAPLADYLSDGAAGYSAAYSAAYGKNATWSWFDAASYSAAGELSAFTASARVEVYGVQRTGYVRANRRDTLIERTSVLAARRLGEPCPPARGSYWRVDASDAGSAIEAPGYPNATGRYARRDPPWTVEAWVRRDDSLVEQTLFAGPDGASVALELGPATGKVGAVTPADFAAVTSARRAFADARNNTAAESAAERVRAALASAKRWNYTAPVRAWTHLAFVAVPANASAYDSGGGGGGLASTTRTNDVVVRLYVDGAFHSSVALESEMPMPLGAVGGPGRAAFAIDEVRFWTRALAPWEVWGTRGEFLNGDEAGLLAYLPLEEGCGASARDVAAANDAVQWNLTARNATWEWQRRAFACATLRAVSPTVAPASGGSRITLFGSGFARKPHHSGAGRNVSVCRFGYRGGAGAGAVEMPATVVSDGIVTCAAPPAIRDENRGRGGAVSVQFCDPGMSCCSEPESAAFAGPPPDFHARAAADASLPTNASLPASFLAPPRGKRVGSGEYPQILYREARVVAARPRRADASRGAIVSVLGWGFAARGHDASLLESGPTCEFTAVDESVAYSPEPPFWVSSRGNLSATEKKTETLALGSATARVVSGAEATCELPPLPSAWASRGFRASVVVRVALRLDAGGAVAGRAEIDVSGTVTLGSPLTDRASARASSLYSGATSSASSSASEASSSAASSGSHSAFDPRSPSHASFPPWSPRGPPEGGSATTLLADASFDDVRSERTFDSACAFGTTRPVAARPAGPRTVTCVAPAAPRPGARVEAPLAATVRAGAGRFEAPVATFAWIARPTLFSGAESGSPTYAIFPGLDHEVFATVEGAGEGAGDESIECRVVGDAAGGSVRAAARDSDVGSSANRTSSITGLTPSARRFACGFGSAMGAGGARGGFAAIFIHRSTRASPDGDVASSGAHVASVRADARLASVGNAPGSSDGGYLLAMRGAGFLPGDALALTLGPESSPSESQSKSERSQTEPSKMAAAFAECAFVTSALILCEAPATARVAPASAPLAARLAVPSLGVSAPPRLAPERYSSSALSLAPTRRDEDAHASIVDASAPLPREGGASVATLGAFADALGAVVSDRRAENGTASVYAPACRFGAVDVAARRVDGSVASACVSPAIGGYRGDGAAYAASYESPHLGAKNRTLRARREVTLARQVEVRFANDARPGWVGAALPRGNPLAVAPRADGVVVHAAMGPWRAAGVPRGGVRGDAATVAGALAFFDPNPNATEDGAGDGVLGSGEEKDAAETEKDATRIACRVRFPTGHPARADGAYTPEDLAGLDSAASGGERSNQRSLRGVLSSALPCLAPAWGPAAPGARVGGFVVVDAGVTWARRADRVAVGRGAITPARRWIEAAAPYGDHVSAAARANPSSVEFEYAPAPRVHGVALHAGLVPGRIVDVNRAFERRAAARGGFFTATFAVRRAGVSNDAPVFPPGATNAIFLGSDGDFDGASFADDADAGGAWWHVGGAGAGVAPVAIRGAEFRPGGGFGGGGGSASSLVARFEDVRGESARVEKDSGAREGAFADERGGRDAKGVEERSRIVAAHFVSSALVVAEPPGTTEAVVAISVDGGRTFSEQSVVLAESVPA